MDTYSKAEHFLKYPFDVGHGVNTVSKWTPQERTALTIDTDGYIHGKDDVGYDDSVPAPNSTSAYKNIICQFPPPDTVTPISDHLRKLTIGQLSDCWDKDDLDKLESKTGDVTVPDHGLDMAFHRHGDRGIPPYVINTNQRDVIATVSDNRIRLAAVNDDLDQYQEIDPQFHLNLHDPRMPTVARHQVKCYYIVNRK